MITLTWRRKQVLISAIRHFNCDGTLTGEPVFTVCHCAAGEKALVDAGIPYSAIEQACVGYVYGKCMS